MSTADNLLDALEKAITATNTASIALIRHSREEIRNAAARSADDDDWIRLPQPGKRCPITNWSRSTVIRRIEAKDIRSRTTGKMRYYSGTDVRKYITNADSSE